MAIGSYISQLAKSYLGQSEHPTKGDNGGFTDGMFEVDMKGIGWGIGMPWCACFAKLMWKKAYLAYKDVDVIKGIGKLLNPSANSSFDNIRTKGKDYGLYVSNTPVVGSIVVWQEIGKYTGHAAVVVDVDSSGKIKTIDGNSGSDGSRNGVKVAVPKGGKFYNAAERNSKWIVRGYIIPKEPNVKGPVPAVSTATKGSSINNMDMIRSDAIKELENKPQNTNNESIKNETLMKKEEDMPLLDSKKKGLQVIGSKDKLKPVNVSSSKIETDELKFHKYEYNEYLK